MFGCGSWQLAQVSLFMLALWVSVWASFGAFACGGVFSKSVGCELHSFEAQISFGNRWCILSIIRWALLWWPALCNYLLLRAPTLLAHEGSAHCLHLRILWNSSLLAWWMRVGLGMPAFTVEGSMSIVLSMRLQPQWSNHFLEIVRQGTWASMCLTQ